MWSVSINLAFAVLCAIIAICFGLWAVLSAMEGTSERGRFYADGGVLFAGLIAVVFLLFAGIAIGNALNMLRGEEAEDADDREKDCAA